MMIVMSLFGSPETWAAVRIRPSSLTMTPLPDEGHLQADDARHDLLDDVLDVALDGFEVLDALRGGLLEDLRERLVPGGVGQAGGDRPGLSLFGVGGLGVVGAGAAHPDRGDDRQHEGGEGGSRQLHRNRSPRSKSRPVTARQRWGVKVVSGRASGRWVVAGSQKR